MRGLTPGVNDAKSGGPHMWWSIETLRVFWSALRSGVKREECSPGAHFASEGSSASANAM